MLGSRTARYELLRLNILDRLPAFRHSNIFAMTPAGLILFARDARNDRTSISRSPMDLCELPATMVLT